MAQALILYDADCGFCRWSLGALLRWDLRRRLRPLALQSPEAERLLAHMTPEHRMDSFHLVDEAGRVYSAGAAVRELLRRLAGGRPLAALSAALPGATEAAYRWVSSRRSPIGRRLPRSAVRRASARIARRS